MKVTPETMIAVVPDIKLFWYDNHNPATVKTEPGMLDATIICPREKPMVPGTQGHVK